MSANNTIEGYEVHPVCAMFPMLQRGSKHYKDLSASICGNGLFDPIVLDDEGRILDGRNRLVACKESGVEPRFVRLSELGLKDCYGEPITPEIFAFDRNIRRRDLTDDQRVQLFAEYDEYINGAFKTMKEAGRLGGRPRKDEKNPAQKPEQGFSESRKRAPTTNQKLAEAADVSRYKAEQAISLRRKAPRLAKKVQLGEMSLAAAHKAMTHNIDEAILARLPSTEFVEPFIDEVVRLSIPGEHHTRAADFVAKNNPTLRDLYTRLGNWWSLESGEWARQEFKASERRRRERERRAHIKAMTPIHLAFIDFVRQLRGLLPKLESLVQNSEHIPPHIIDNESDTIDRVILALNAIKKSGGRRPATDITAETVVTPEQLPALSVVGGGA